MTLEMVVIDGLVAGKLHGRPEQRMGNNSGKPFVTAKVRAPTAGGETMFVNVLAFDAAVQAALLALADGDTVALAGTLTPKAWTDRRGQARPALDMVAAQVLTAYHVRRKREAVVAGGEQRQQQARQPRQRQESDGFSPDDDAWLHGSAA